MRTTTKRELEAEQSRRLRLYFLHRECVRRNSEYARSFAEVCEITDSAVKRSREHELKAQWGLWPSDTLPDPGERIDLVQLKTGRFPPTTAALTGNLDVDPLENDAQRKLTRHVLDPNKDLLNDVANGLKGFLFLLYFPEEQDQLFPAPWSLTTVDMRRPKKEIIEFFSAWPAHKLHQRATHGLGQARPPVRIHLDEAFDYLKAYDLQRERWTFRLMAEQLWPNLTGEHLTRQAKAYTKKGMCLVQNPPLSRLIQAHIAARRR